MQRAHKQDNDTAQHAAQAKFTARSRENERENSVHDSPAQTAQRMKLQGLFGNAVQRTGTEDELKTAQRVEDKDELQKKSAPAQMKNEDDDKTQQLKTDPAQRKDDDEIQAKRDTQAVQRAGTEEELKQPKFASQAAQLKEAPAAKQNNTGLPDNLKSGIESLSGMSMDNVKVHYNSSQPAQLNALAYAQGTDIHVAPGQEQHLPHEAWHVVQQVQGRVKPTMQMKEGVPVNNDKTLEHEADVMGAKAMQNSFDNQPAGSISLPSEVKQLRYGRNQQVNLDMYDARKSMIDGPGSDPLCNFAYDYDTNSTYFSSSSGSMHAEDKVAAARGDKEGEKINIFTERKPCDDKCNENIKKAKATWNVTYKYRSGATNAIKQWLLNTYRRYKWHGRWRRS